MSRSAQLDKVAQGLPSTRFDALRKARHWVSTLKVSSRVPNTLDDPLPPRHNPEELLGIINPDITKPFGMMEVLVRLVDDSRMELFKPLYGKGLITCWTRIHGQTIHVSV